MEFKFYDEIDPEQANEITLICHNEPNSGKMVAKIRKSDPFCSPWFRMYAVENGKVISQVGAAYPVIETTEGKMKAGFVEAVSSMPSYAQKGYAKALMKRVHEQMLGDGIEIFILGTSKIFVAYSMYPKLGYRDIKEFNWGLKKGQKSPANDITMKVRRHKVDGGDKLFKKISKGNLGFIHRPDDYPRLRSSWGTIYNKTVTFYRNGELIGYAMIHILDTFLRIRELACPNQTDFEPCLNALENYYSKEYVTRSLCGTSNVAKQFEDHGFRTMDTWGTLMAMDSKGRLSQAQIKKLLGVDQDRFQVFSLDTY
jgi:GNAT superfamily N-acetyltransferase